MQTNTMSMPQVDRVSELLCKLAGLPSEKLNMALIACSVFIDGMNAQERLAVERDSA